MKRKIWLLVEVGDLKIDINNEGKSKNENENENEG